jgi:serine/threonine protein kinase
MQIAELENHQLKLFIRNQNEPDFIAFNKMYTDYGEELKNTYTTIPKSISSGSFGTVYRMCLNNKCDFVAKWQPITIRSSLNTQLAEAFIQNCAGDISPNIKQIFTSKKGSLIIMNALEKALEDEIFSVTENQIKSATIRFLNDIKLLNILRGSKMKQFFKRDVSTTEMKLIQTFNNNGYEPYEDEIILIERYINSGNYSYKMFLELIRINLSILEKERQSGYVYYRDEKTPNNIYTPDNFNITIHEEDDRNDIHKKSGIIRDVLNTLSTLHDGGIIHGDCHLGNFMFDKKGDVKIIDYSFSRIYPELTSECFDKYKDIVNLNRTKNVKGEPVIISSQSEFEKAQKSDYEHLLKILDMYIEGSYDVVNRKHMIVKHKNLKYLYDIVEKYIKSIDYLQRLNELDSLLANEMITPEYYAEEIESLNSS